MSLPSMTFDVTTNAHLFKYDSNYGKYPGTVEVDGTDLSSTATG